MKKLLLSIILGAISVCGQAQSGKVVSAWKYLSDFNENKDTSSLMKGKEAIDLASLNEDTKNEAKTWMYRGKIYQAIFEENLKRETEKLIDITDPNKKTMTGYQKTSSSELEQAHEAYVKAIELDVKYKADLEKDLKNCSKHFENKGVAYYNTRDFAGALPMFEKALDLNTKLGRVDSSNTNNSAIVAERSGNYEKAKIYYQKLADMKYGKGNTYSSLAAMQFILKDTVGATDAIKKGREAYPGDVNLIIMETNQALRMGQNDKAIENLKLTIQKMPTDANLYLVLGNVYDNMANPKDATGKELEKPLNYEELLKSAEANYKKAIELKPDYFDAIYNLGVLYNNHGVAISKQADTIIEHAKLASANALANQEFNKATPVLEKALELNPKDRATMLALKQLYARLQLVDKLNAINEKLKN